MGKRRGPGSASKAYSAGKRRLTVELARTWLVSVINPILEGLRKEQVWLTRQNWTWRYSSGTFDYLWPVVLYVHPAYRDNFTEFCTWYPQVAMAIRDHDSALSELSARCNTARDAPTPWL